MSRRSRTMLQYDSDVRGVRASSQRALATRPGCKVALIGKVGLIVTVLIIAPLQHTLASPVEPRSLFGSEGSFGNTRAQSQIASLEQPCGGGLRHSHHQDLEVRNDSELIKSIVTLNARILASLRHNMNVFLSGSSLPNHIQMLKAWDHLGVADLAFVDRELKLYQQYANVSSEQRRLGQLGHLSNMSVYDELTPLLKRHYVILQRLARHLDWEMQQSRTSQPHLQRLLSQMTSLLCEIHISLLERRETRQSLHALSSSSQHPSSSLSPNLPDREHSARNVRVWLLHRTYERFLGHVLNSLRSLRP